MGLLSTKVGVPPGVWAGYCGNGWILQKFLNEANKISINLPKILYLLKDNFYTSYSS